MLFRPLNLHKLSLNHTHAEKRTLSAGQFRGLMGELLPRRCVDGADSFENLPLLSCSGTSNSLGPTLHMHTQI